MKPFPFQLDAAKKMLTRSCVMLDADMGVGKTIISLTALKMLNQPKTLVVCPAVAITNWAYEAEKWGVAKENIDIYSYDKVRTPKVKQKILENQYEVLILDEAHYAKNPESKRTQAIYGNGGLATKIKRVWLLSGTFAPNNASEYFPHLFCCFRELLPFGCNSFWNFREHFCVTVPRQVGRYRIDVVVNNRNTNELKKILQQTSIKIKARDVLPELPPLQWAMLPLDSTFPKDLSVDMEEFQEFLESGYPISASSSMMQARRLIAEHKISPIRLFLQDFMKNSTQKIVIFSLHLEPLRQLHESFKHESVLLTGAVPSHKRGQLIQQFQENPRTRLFFGQLTTANTAITLTAAHRVLFIDQSFVPGENLQAASRCHRIGQHHPVLAQVAIIPHSIDEAVSSVLINKTRMLTELEYANSVDA